MHRQLRDPCEAASEVGQQSVSRREGGMRSRHCRTARHASQRRGRERTASAWGHGSASDERVWDSGAAPVNHSAPCLRACFALRLASGSGFADDGNEYFLDFGTSY